MPNHVPPLSPEEFAARFTDIDPPFAPQAAVVEATRSLFCYDATGTVACIGAGPASLACAAELRRHGIAVTIFDRNPLAGGLYTYGIAEYKLRPADSRKEVDLVRAMGVEFRLGEAAPDAAKLDAEFDA